MAEQPILNIDLEQALYKATLREKKLRRQAILSVFLPVILGGIWLFYSVSEVSKLRTHSRAIEEREAIVEQRENEASHRVATVEAQADKSEMHARELEEGEKAAKAHAEDMQQRLVKVRDEIGGLGVLLTDLSSARAKASKLAASEAVESQLSDIRSTLARVLGSAEQQIDSVLPPAAQKARVYLFIADEQQRESAGKLKTQVEGNGFEVPAITRNSGRRIDTTEVRYFREPEDKADAARLLELFEKQSGQPGGRIVNTPDPDHASGARKFQIWLAKDSTAAR